MGKKGKVIGALLLLVCFALLHSGCAGNADKTIENVVGGLMEAENKSIEAETASSESSEDHSAMQSSGSEQEEQDSGNGLVQTNGSSKTIPKDYPKDFCPIYEPSTIIDVQRIQVGNEGLLNFIITFVSEDDVFTVGDFYKQLEYATSEVSLGDVLCQVHMKNKLKKTNEGTVSIEKTRDEYASYADQGFESYTSILVEVY